MFHGWLGIQNAIHVFFLWNFCDANDVMFMENLHGCKTNTKPFGVLIFWSQVQFSHAMMMFLIFSMLMPLGDGLLCSINLTFMSRLVSVEARGLHVILNINKSLLCVFGGCSTKCRDVLSWRKLGSSENIKQRLDVLAKDTSMYLILLRVYVAFVAKLGVWHFS